MKLLKKIVGTIYGTLVTSLMFVPLGTAYFLYDLYNEAKNLFQTMIELNLGSAVFVLTFGTLFLLAVPGCILAGIGVSLWDSIKQGLRTGKCMNQRSWLAGLIYPFKTIKTLAPIYLVTEDEDQINKKLEQATEPTFEEYAKDTIQQINAGITKCYAQNGAKSPTIPPNISAMVADLYLGGIENSNEEAEQKIYHSLAIQEYHQLQDPNLSANEQDEKVFKKIYQISEKNHKASYRQRLSVYSHGLFTTRLPLNQPSESDQDDFKLSIGLII